MKKNIYLILLFAFSNFLLAQEQTIINIQNLDINTEYADFGVSFYKDNLVLYASSIKDRKLKRKDRSHNRMDYLRFYIGNILDQGQIISKDVFSREKYNMIHESDITFTKDWKTIYFTLNNYIKADYRKIFIKKKHKNHILNIFKATIDDNGIATNIEPVPFNSEDYSVSNPELSPDGKTLYFSSDMDGGFGMNDIYKVTINEDGTYGEPENLGEKINTKYNEFFPFLSTYNTFYFTSDGHGGKGFLDIFSCNFTNNTYSPPTNLSDVNSKYDDFAFIISPEQNVGYFSSSRKGKGNADIYSFQMDLVKCSQTITGIVKNEETNEVLSNANVKLTNDSGFLKNTTTNNNGKFKFNIDCKTKYSINTSKEYYLESEKISFTTSKENSKNKDLLLYLNPVECKQTIAGIVTNKETQVPIKNIEVTLLNDGIVIEETITQTNGLFNFNIQVDCKTSYKVVVEIENYNSKIESFITSDNPNKENYLEIELQESEEFFTSNNIKRIRTKPILFDLNSDNIRRDIAVELNKVILIMRKYPSIKVELKYHTDSRASDDYNMKLSKRRAKSSVQYIISQGIDSNRITGEGYGETRLVNRCSNNVKCSEDEHQENRRTEFIVISK